jgi:alkaline phosphatase
MKTTLHAAALAAACISMHAEAAPAVSRLTPPSELFASGNAQPIVARFLPGQRFDLQATVRPDAGQRIESFEFAVDGKKLTPAAGTTSLVTTGLVKGLPPNTAVVSQRAFSLQSPGVHRFSVTARQSDGQAASAEGNFEVVALAQGARPAKNVIILLGDGMGSTHRTAARVVARGYAQGKARGLLAMDTFPVTGQVMTASLNSIITDSSPGMSNYVNGNKAANNQEGVWPDDTEDAFDNPRVEYLAEYLHRTQGKSLGLVTTADVFDATPAANAVHTANRGRGTGIVDQYLDDRSLTGLTVLMGGGRKWFLPNPGDQPLKPQPANGSQRQADSDYMLPDDIVNGWKAARGRYDPERDLIRDFEAAGFAYAPDRASLANAAGASKLLGLFAYSNMNVAFDKIAGRRGHREVVDAFGFPDQPMLDEMTDAALKVLAKNPKGFVAMIEGASIDKQAHLMDTDRWLLEVVEFDRAIQVAKDFAERNPDTIVIVTADHECSGAAIIGASKVGVSALKENGGKDAKALREAVGVYEAAGFPRYDIQSDGYPATTDVDKKMLVGYGANADRYETWLAAAQPTQDSQQPFVDATPLSEMPKNPAVRNEKAGLLVTGQVPGEQAVHTGADVPLSAYGRGAMLFTGTYDNTDVFFKLAQIAIRGVPR